MTVPADLSVGDFMDAVVWRRRRTTYSVLGVDGTVLELLAFRCVTAVPGAEWDSRSVADCMIPADGVPRFGPRTPAIDAFTELSASDVNRGVVIQDGRLTGIVSAADFARALRLRPPWRGAATGHGADR